MLLSIIYTYVIDEKVSKILQLTLTKIVMQRRKEAEEGRRKKIRPGGGNSLIPRPFLPPVFDCSQYANWRQEWPGTRLSQPGSCTQHIQCHVVG